MSKYEAIIAPGAFGPGLNFLGDFDPNSIDTLQIHLSQAIAQAKPKASAGHFDEEEYKRHMDLWLANNSAKTHKHDKNGIHLEMQNGCRITIQKNQVTMSPNADGAAIRALVLHAKENWGGKIAPLGTNHDPHQLLMVWAHCQAQGVEFCGPQPSKEMADQMKPLIAHLKAQEATPAPEAKATETAKTAPIAAKAKPAKKFDINEASNRARNKVLRNAGAKL